MADRTMSRPGMPAAALAILGLTVCQTAVFLWAVGATTIREPFWDMLTFADDYMRCQRAGNLPGCLWLPDNEHHSVWSRLLTLVELRWFDGRGWSFQLFSLALLALGPVLIGREIMIGLPRQAMIWRVAGAGLVTALFLTAANAATVGVPMNGGYPQAVGFTLLALAIPGDAAAEWRRVAACCLACVAAACANAIGLLGFPVLIWVLWRARAGVARIAAVALTALLFGAVYVAGLDGTASPAATAIGSVAQLVKTVAYGLTFLGLPWTRLAALAVAGRALGAILLAASLAGVIVAPRTRLARLAVGMILFSLGAAALAALGRADLAEDVRVPVRYAVLVAPLHAGLLLLALPWLVRRSLAWPRPMAGAAVLGSVFLLVQQLPAALSAARAAAEISGETRAFFAGEERDGMSRVVYPDMAVARRIRADLRAAGLYLWLK